MGSLKGRLEIYTDGACSTNGTWESGAAIGVYLNNQRIRHEGKYLGKATNNIAELKAFEMALGYILEHVDYTDDIHILSDSAYIVNCINDKWYVSWQKNGWLTSQKAVVKNRDIWESIISKYNLIQDKFTIKVIKVKGHSDNPFNNAVDRIAVHCKDTKGDFIE